MSTKILLFLSILTIYTSNASVLIWSKKKLTVSPFESYDHNTFKYLLNKMDFPEVVMYKTTARWLPKFEKLLKGYYTAFSANVDLDPENATVIEGQDDLDLLEMKQRFDLAQDNDILSILSIPNVRRKRDAAEASTAESVLANPKGPVLYRGKTKNDIYTLLHSSQPLVLKTGSNFSIELGEAISVTIDKQSKNTSVRLDSTIPVRDEKYILQFSFVWNNNYWNLATVRVKTTISNFSINLFNIEPFSAPARFSYHCNGVTVFTDPERTTELWIYDMQAQPDSKDGAFGDAYDCVDFTTVPILSGLFITALLGVGLLISLYAIAEIKTMDKFDNHKTKQLSITVSE